MKKHWIIINKSLTLAEKHNNTERIQPSLTNIGLVYTELGNYLQAKPFLIRALKLARESKQISTIVSPLQNIGNMFIKLKKLKKAETYLLEAMEICQKYNFKLHKPECLTGLSNRRLFTELL